MESKETEETARVLVVDDVPENVALIEAILTLAGYEVGTAYDGEEALEKIQREPFDVVLLDVMMPKLDGYEVCARLKGNERTRLIPVVLITPGQQPVDRHRSIDAGSHVLLERPFSRVELLAWVRSLVRLKHLNDELINVESAILALARSVEAKDPYTKGHLESVVTYAANLGKEIRLSRRAQELLRKGAILHDVGKIGVRDWVLLKPGPLSREEFDELKIHPVVGEHICQPLQVKTVLEMVRHHHERYDGKGYPDGLAGKAIPIAARIMTIVDAYDALTRDRPHWRKVSQKEALDELVREAGRQFDPALVPVFTELAESGRLSQASE